MRTIRHCSEVEALTLKPGRASALISITDPGRIAPLPYPDAWGALLRIHVLDAEYDSDTIAAMWPDGSFDADQEQYPSMLIAMRIRDFIALCEDMPITTLIVHCQEGRRRSAAVAQFVADRWGQPTERSTDQLNRTLYELLCDPRCMDAISDVSWSRRIRSVTRTWMQRLVAGHRHGRR